MDFLASLKLANAAQDRDPASFSARMRIAIVTNFTDDLLKKVLTGLCLHEDVFPDIHVVPFKQYLFELKKTDSALHQFRPDVTFLFFDVNPYLASEFSTDPTHAETILQDIRTYCSTTSGVAVAHTLSLPVRAPNGDVFRSHELRTLAQTYNAQLGAMADEFKNLHVLDTNRLLQTVGEEHSRDVRGLYAFGQPFRHEFLFRVSSEWMAYIRALLGKVRKCIVVDLDNTLWGNIVSEVGPLGIVLGPDYPGNAYQQFQRVLLEYFQRGIILAINSRNNPEDVDEVFEKNPYMLLQKKHFAAMCVNWNTKAENLEAIAKELNIGLDSMVFFDDDAMNRDLVRTQLPTVLVPEFSLPPEQYVKTLLDLDVFHQLQVTDEDRLRGQMYAEEGQRNVVRAATQSLEEYLAALKIEILIRLNDVSAIPRLSQLTMKTNQFNLTTHRYTEQRIQELMTSGFIYAGDVSDKFGAYGLTVQAIVQPVSAEEVDLDTFLMSCRVMGRGVEMSFFHAIATDLARRGFQRLTATFIPTLKNPPSANFLPELGFTTMASEEGGATRYVLSLADYLASHEASPHVHVQLHS